MDSQILVILFILFSVVSSIFKKLKERNAPDESKLQRKHPSRQVGADDPFEEDVDLSEWEILLGAPQEPKKEAPKPVIQEFREVHGKRRVDESDTGPEFQAVHGKRPVSETNTGPEFKTVRATRPVDESSAYNENDPTDTLARLKRSKPLKAKRKHKRRLSFSHKNIRQAIVYNEIIGPPRSEHMPFE
ncbi:MAG: hypothetical protein HOE48_12785 [Candidatus Latescibacteria bacterium]|jgi:hypothetical protein|nr:hypothetical protein [Candidatus Latescibacterota bacterium]MBT5828567.1 hypothetical protein [Candidatus Latescibacterota bacterium]